MTHAHGIAKYCISAVYTRQVARQYGILWLKKEMSMVHGSLHIFRGLTKLKIKEMLKFSDFYLDKQKSFIPKKNTYEVYHIP